MHIRRAESERYGPTKGRPVCQEVIRASIPSFIAATHSDECRERKEESMMQDFEAAGRVASTRFRFHEALAKDVQACHER